ncbi:MAG: aminopeptidase P family protein [Clostridiales bacterium]|nr:aminopeptidase P family protein [Clostridiales bacterium]
MKQSFLDRVAYQLKSLNIDAMLIVPSEELRLMMGINPLLFERFQGLFVKQDGTYFYFCNLLSGDEVAQVLGEDKVITWFDNEVFTDVLRGVFEKQGLIGKTIALNSTARAFNIKRIEAAIPVTFIDGKGLIEAVNMIKDKDELQGLREASKKADKVMLKTISFIRPGMVESEIVAFVEQSFIDEGCEPDFALVASGSNTALPHYTGTSRIIREKDIVLLDIGGKLNGFSSDTTRTVFVGEPSEEMRKVYDLVLKANLAGEKAAKAGVIVGEVDKAARAVIEEGGYGKYFTTRVGHGIGYSTHEEPYMTQINDKTLAPGMAFTVEPGIYMKDLFGVRIEDTLIMTEDGLEVLNQVSKELRIICD